MATAKERKRACRDAGGLQSLLTLHEVALDTMSHGLCMFDAEYRVVLFNHRYLEMFNLSPDVVRPGIGFREVLAHSAARGNFPVSAIDAKWGERRHKLLRGKGFRLRQQLPTGATVELNFRPMADGGWVSIYEDVSAAQRMEYELRLQIERLDQAFTHMSHGLCLFDGDERLVVCNERYLQIYGLDAALVRPGITFREILAHAVAIGNHRSLSADQLYAKRIAMVRERAIVTQPLALDDGRVIETTIRPIGDGGWVADHEDVTARLRYEEALREQNMRFDAAIGNMAHGLSMFDADERLIVCNAQYLRLYNLDPAVVKPGITHRELVAHSRACGNCAAVPVEEFHEQRLSAAQQGKSLTVRILARDGRVIEATSRPTPDGGWVMAHEDITRRLRQEEKLREQNLRFDAALNNMSHGLCMYDEDRRVIVFNQRFLALFGMSAEVIRPGITLRDVMEHSAAVGNYPGRTGEELYADYIAQLKAGNPTMHRQLADGRVIQVVHRPMPQGGWVATYEDVTERLKTEERISHMARHDALTGLPNRVLFREKMADGLARVEQHSASMAVLCLDLDNFKAVNDTLGHPIGDRLLSTVAQRLICVLEQDDTIARLGGDEFAILQGDPQPQAAEALARRIVEVLSQPIVIDEHEINTGVSIGIAVAPNDGMAADHLMKCADLALYRAKAEGRARYRFFEPDMDTRLREKRALELDLRKALANGEFDLVYQPQVRASDNELTGMEALLRWTRAERGPVPPAEFIPIAEETGLIVPLGEWVLRRACGEAARWPGAIKVAVNLSPVQFKGRGLVATVASALAASGLPAQRLELEITEAVLLQDDDMTLAMLHQLRALGVRISMDDFGTGYSSLSYLRSFPFDKIKIDRRFISDLERGKDSAAIVRAVAGLGASLGIETTAEGVETAEQLELVRRDGCTEVQGFFFSPPRPAAQVLAMFGKLEQEKAVA